MDILPFAGSGRNAAGSAPPARAPSPGSPLDKPLFEAVQAHGMRTRGLPANLVTVQYADGSAVTIPVPPAEPALAASFWPRPQGWDFRSGEAAFDGVRFRVSGRNMVALRSLARSPGCPVQVEHLIRETWGEEPARVELATVHSQLSSLRRILRTALALPAKLDPIPFLDGAYTLTVGAADEAEGRESA